MQNLENIKSKISNPDELVDIFFELTKTKYSYFKYMYEIDIKESKAYQKLITRNEEYPENFWKSLYRVCTGEDLDHKTFWQKLFSFFK